MAKFSEMSWVTRLGIMLLGGVLIFGAVWFLVLSDMNQKNKATQVNIDAKKSENAQLQQLEPKLAQTNKEIEDLQREIEIEKKIVPEDKDADQFIKLLHDTASAAGIEIRRYTSVPGVNHEYYGEVSFAIDLDGPYYSMLNFFDRMARLERIVNMTNLQVGNMKSASAAKVRTAYSFLPNETVLASCTATTFYSHDRQPEAATPATAVKK